MTSNDFFLLFAAFAGFVLAPTLLFWGLARLVDHGKNGGADGGLRSNTEANRRADNEQDKEAARSEESNASLDRLGSGSAWLAPGAALSPY